MGETIELIHNHDLVSESEESNNPEQKVRLKNSIDYVGFTFNGRHSSQLGIVRTSDGSRFNENLLPTMQDKTVQIPGGDGTYYFGSYYTQRQFNIQFAFDDLTEQEFADLKRWLGDKQIHELIFDETPYKAYQAKVTGSATMKYIPFEEGATNRVYKGEGSVQFTAYQPYAYSSFSFIDDDIKNQYGNINEWLEASRMRTNPYGITYYNELITNDENKSMNLYNGGDIETHFQLKVSFNEKKISLGKFYIDGDVSKQLAWSEIAAQDEDSYIKFNSKLNLIEGYNADDKKTGNIYNQYITEGSFFKIPLGESVLIFETDDDLTNVTIEYNYYYI